MSTFRRLPGLPPYGPAAIPVPSDWGRIGREGFVVEFHVADGSTWVGNFGPGLGGLNDVRNYPNGRDVLVASSGALRRITPETRTGQEIAPAVFGVWQVADRLVYDLQGLAFVCIGKAGVVWRTRRISWDWDCYTKTTTWSCLR